VIDPVAQPTELADLQGAWRREGRSLSDAPSVERAEVVWLQVGRHFCDLRTPYPQMDPTHVLDQPQAFSGTVRLDAGSISFHHDLDSLRRDPAHPDEGTVHRKGNVMIERGPGFEERWVVMSSPEDEVGLAEARSGANDAPVARLIRIGSVALAVWGGATAGGAQFTLDKNWHRDRSLHDVEPAIGVDVAARRMGRGEPLPEGWVVLERGEV